MCDLIEKSSVIRGIDEWYPFRPLHSPIATLYMGLV